MNEIALISKARLALEKAKTICEALEIHAQAGAMEVYLKRKEGYGEAAHLATEMRLRTERKIGEMLKAKGEKRGRPEKSGLGPQLPKDVTRDQSSDWQRIASIPDEVFEKALAEPEPTTKGLLRLAVMV